MTKRKAGPTAEKSDWDKRLAKIARQMIAAGRAGESLLPVLTGYCPQVHQQLALIATQPKLLSLWGRSENIDELAGEEIVDSSILNLIAEITGEDMTPPTVHAGLQHTYGYLFSLLNTPYGYKRERWTRPDVERGFGITQPTLRVDPAAGTLLTNLTYFIGRIAFRGRRREIAMLRRHKMVVAPCLTVFNYRQLKRTSIVERLKEPSAARVIEMHTELIRFPYPTSDDPYFLVYWVADSSESTGKLITAFPVDQLTFDELTRQKQGLRVKVRARFNGVIDGVTGSEKFGSREFV